MPAPSIADPAVTIRPAARRRPRLRAVPDAGPATQNATTSTANAAGAAGAAGAVTDGATALAGPALLPGRSHSPAPAPLTVTISVDGGAPEARDRLAAALRDLVATAGPEVVSVASEPLPSAAEPGVVHVDPEPRAAFRDGRRLDLSRLEYDLLLFFARHPRQVFSRGQLLAEVWGHVHTGARTVDVHVSRLRHKLGEPELIATVYGVGNRQADAAPVRVVPPRAGGVSCTA